MSSQGRLSLVLLHLFFVSTDSLSFISLPLILLFVNFSRSQTPLILLHIFQNFPLSLTFLPSENQILLSIFEILRNLLEATAFLSGWASVMQLLTQLLTTFFFPSSFYVSLLVLAQHCLPVK